MKRAFILISVIILCTGCMQINNTTNYGDIVDNVINNSKGNVNTTSLGYKYYLPLGVSKLYDKDYNQKFKVGKTTLYMYVDSVSYYYRNALNFNDETVGSYYYQRISNGEKIGYIKITEEDNRYFLKIVYNYAKIEAYTSKEELNNILTCSMIILDSIDYNDNLIQKILEDEYFSSVDKEYKINKPADAESKFSEYLSEYANDEDSVVPDLPEY